MNSYVFLFAFISELAAIQSDDLNVGTVLFSPSDINKRWSATEIALLRARRHFQAMIPPPNPINTNEDFINSILGYFKDSYSLVKSEAKDPETDSIMNAALSDAIGGYLKAWVLPITKFAYYGGTVSEEEASKLFQLYDEIKLSLDTDGKAWRSPNINLLKSVAINVAPLRSTPTRGVEKPCDSFAYFENTPIGLSIPVPNVSWNESAESMFVPLKNHSLIPLHSPNNDSLIKYYDEATKCIEASNLENQSQFETRFQMWLNKEVLPHLNDEKFYPALGSVLTLVNRTRSLIDTVIDLYAEKLPVVKKTTIAGIPVNLSSKKMMVIFVVIILELAWCIPTLCYFLCVRMKRNKQKNVYLYVGKGKRKKDKKYYPCMSVSTQFTPPECENSTTVVSEGIKINKHDVKTATSNSRQREGVALHQEPRPKSCNIEIQRSSISCKPYAGKSTRSYHSPQMHFHDVTRILDADSIQPRKSFTKKSSVNEFDTQKSSSKEMFYKNCFNITGSITMPQELEPTKTVTILKKHNKISKIAENGRDAKDTQKTGKEAVVVTASTREPLTCNLSKDQAKRAKPRDDSVNTSTSLFKPDSKIAQIRNQNVVNDNSQFSTGRPYLEIKIDRPQKKISVDFNHIGAHVAKARQSKIPKRAFNNSEAQTCTLSSKNTQMPSFCNRQSFIPQPRRQKTVDDIIIKSKKTSNQTNVLNMSF